MPKHILLDVIHYSRDNSSIPLRLFGDNEAICDQVHYDGAVGAPMNVLLPQVGLLMGGPAANRGFYAPGPPNSRPTCST